MAGLFGSSAPAAPMTWQDRLRIIGASFQDAGASLQGRQGSSLKALQEAQKRAQQDAAYQASLAQLFGTPEINTVRSTPSVLSGDTLGILDAQAHNAQPMTMSGPLGQAIGFEQAQALAPILGTLEASQGIPVMLQALQGARERQDRRGDRREDLMLAEAERARTRSEQVQDNARTLLNPAEVQAAGYRPGTVLYRDGLGRVHVGQESDVMSEAAERQKIRIAAAGRETGGSGGTGNIQSIQPLADGTLMAVRRDGTVERLTIDGQPVQSAQYTPETRFNLAAASAGGRTAGTLAESWPQAQVTYRLIDDTLKKFDDPKIKAEASKAIGFGAIAPTIPGVNSEFRALQAQIGGQAFTQAFESLKGGGQITEREGTAATQARLRMINANTPEEFYRALADFRKVLGDSHYAARKRAERGAKAIPAISPDELPKTNQRRTVKFGDLP